MATPNKKAMEPGTVLSGVNNYRLMELVTSEQDTFPQISHEQIIDLILAYKPLTGVSVDIKDVE